MSGPSLAHQFIGSAAIAVACAILAPGQPQSMVLSIAGCVLWSVLLLAIERGRKP